MWRIKKISDFFSFIDQLTKMFWTSWPDSSYDVSHMKCFRWVNCGWVINVSSKVDCQALCPFWSLIFDGQRLTLKSLFCLSVLLSVYPFVCLSFWTSVCPSICLSILLSDCPSFCQAVLLYGFLSSLLCVCICPLVRKSFVCLYILLSLCLSFCLSVLLS